MGKLSSFCGDGGRRGWLALIVGLVVALLVSEVAWAAKFRGRDRSDRRGDYNNNSFGGGNSRQSFESGGRASSDSGSSARASNTAAKRDVDKDANDKNDRANEKNDKNAKASKDDDDDDDRGGAQKDTGKGQTKANAGRADDAEPPRTVVEMLQ